MLPTPGINLLLESSGQKKEPLPMEITTECVTCCNQGTPHKLQGKGHHFTILYWPKFLHVTKLPFRKDKGTRIDKNKE